MGKIQCFTPKCMQAPVQICDPCYPYEACDPQNYMCCCAGNCCNYSRQEQFCPIPRILKRCKSRELTGSLLMTQCECVKRNGLQTDCPRLHCKGRVCCLKKPIPSCCPSKFYWRFANMTMGRKSQTSSKNCDVTTKGVGCNPCVVDCTKKGKYRMKIGPKICQRIRTPKCQMMFCQPSNFCLQAYDPYCPELTNC